MARELFAWQGFTITLDADWRPTVVSGAYKRGYLRFEGERENFLQIRWETAAKKDESLRSRASKYLASLEKECSKRRANFTSSIKLSNGYAEFEWHSVHKGYGRIWQDSDSKRVFFLECSGSREGPLKREARTILDSFQCAAEALVPWRIFGLHVQLPREYVLSSCTFLTGKIRLNFARKSTSLRAEKWSLAESLLREKSLAQWSEQVTDCKIVEELCDFVRLESRGFFGKCNTALVKLYPDDNQLTLLRSNHKTGADIPSREWLP